MTKKCPNEGVHCLIFLFARNCHKRSRNTTGPWQVRPQGTGKIFSRWHHQRAFLSCSWTTSLCQPKVSVDHNRGNSMAGPERKHWYTLTDHQCSCGCCLWHPHEHVDAKYDIPGAGMVYIFSGKRLFAYNWLGLISMMDWIFSSMLQFHKITAFYSFTGVYLLSFPRT